MIDYPAPDVRCRDATAEEICTSARGVLDAAKDHGWTVRATYARGVPSEGDGTPMRVVEMRPRFEEDTGEPVLTPGGKPAFEQVPTDEYVKVESVVLRMDRGNERLRAAWQRRYSPESPPPWKFVMAWTSPVQKISSLELKKRIKTPTRSSDDARRAEQVPDRARPADDGTGDPGPAHETERLW